MTGIYEIRNKITNQVYIGQSQNVEKRLSHHKWALLNNKHENSYLQRSFNKYKADAFEFIKLVKCSEKMLDECEKFYIHIMKSRKKEFGFNNESGGNKRKKHSKETKEKCRLSHLGNKASDETKAKISAAKKNKKMSDETKEKISNSNKGKNKDKHNSNAAKKIRCVETGIIYESAAECERQTGIGRVLISQNITNPKRHKTAKGYHFEKVQ